MEGVEDVQSLGEKCKELRNALNMTQKDLAEMLDINVKSIQRYENNQSRPDTYTLVKLAVFFDVSADYLLGLKGIKDEIEERNEKISDIKGTFYQNYIKSKNQYEIDKEATYYWIESKDDIIGGQTMWGGYTEDIPPREIRVLRPVIPDKAIEMCTRVYGKPMVINTEEDALTFMVFGGQAIVKKEICERYLPWFLKPFVVEREGLEY